MNSLEFQGLGSSLFSEQSTAVSFIRVEVALKPNSMLLDLSNEYSKEIERLTRFNAKGSLLTQELMYKYLNTVIYLHICNVNGSFPREYQQLKNRMVIPTVFSAILSHIGEVVDKSFGLKFIPTFDVDSKNLLSPSEIWVIIDEFYLLESVGLKMTTSGFLNPKDCGSLGFMGCQLVSNGDILSYRHDSPVFGFYKAMFDSSALETVLGLQALRVKYGTFDHYKDLVKSLVNEVERNH